MENTVIMSQEMGDNNKKGNWTELLPTNGTNNNVEMSFSGSAEAFSDFISVTR